MKRILLLSFVVTILARAEVIKVGPLAGIDLNEIPQKWRAVLASANEDCLEVEASRLPKHSEPFPLEDHDGGTRAFIGDNYVLVLRKSLFPLSDTNKIIGYSYGYELYFGTIEDIEKNPGMRAFFSKVWFVTSAQLAAIEKANFSALEARMPPLEKYVQLREKNPPDSTKKPNQTDGANL